MVGCKDVNVILRHLISNSHEERWNENKPKLTDVARVDFPLLLNGCNCLELLFIPPFCSIMMDTKNLNEDHGEPSNHTEMTGVKCEVEPIKTDHNGKLNCHKICNNEL